MVIFFIIVCLNNRPCYCLLLWRPASLRLDGHAGTRMSTSDQGRASTLLFGEGKEACLNDSHRLLGWWTLACNNNKKNQTFFLLLSAFYLEHFAEMLYINAVFQTVSSFHSFFSSPPFLSTHLPLHSMFQWGRYIKSARVEISVEPWRFIHWIKCPSHFPWLLGQDIEQLNKHVCEMSRKTNNPLLFVDGGSPTWGRGSCSVTVNIIITQEL